MFRKVTLPKQAETVAAPQPVGAQSATFGPRLSCAQGELHVRPETRQSSQPGNQIPVGGYFSESARAMQEWRKKKESVIRAKRTPRVRPRLAWCSMGVVESCVEAFILMAIRSSS